MHSEEYTLTESIVDISTSEEELDYSEDEDECQ